MYQFNDSPDHPAAINAHVDGDNLVVIVEDGAGLSPNTEYHFDTSYTYGIKGHQELDQSVMSNAAGGVTAIKPLSAIFGSVSPPTVVKAGKVDAWIKLPGSTGTLGQPATITGGIAEIDGKLKLA